MKRTIASLSISARATIDMHSLNNEGTEGNETQPRQAEIIGDDGQLYPVNTISGGMLKHIQTQHFYELARAAALPLCAGCARFDANRINADQAWIAELSPNDPENLSHLLARCALDDTAGCLIAISGHHLPRKSVVEFGWVVGLPELVTSRSYFHVRFSPTQQQAADASAEPMPANGTNLGQMIFHRPASSGIYAIGCHVELWRIGYNEMNQAPAFDEHERLRRATLVLQSVLHTFLEPKGAMRSTQLPHLVALEGIVAYSSSRAIPAPLVSALAGGQTTPSFYQEQAQKITQVLHGRLGVSVSSQAFETLADFAEQVGELIDDLAPETDA
jgi:CRISPR-associated protein Cst2